MKQERNKMSNYQYTMRDDVDDDRISNCWECGHDEFTVPSSCGVLVCERCYHHRGGDLECGGCGWIAEGHTPSDGECEPQPIVKKQASLPLLEWLKTDTIEFNWFKSP